MKQEEAEEFTQAIGQSVSGAWRTIATAKRLGVPAALGLSVEDWVNKRLGGYVRMNVEDRRLTVHELKAEGMSNREAAEIIGVDEGTIRGDLSAENSAPATNGYEQNQVLAETAAENSAPLDAVAGLAVSEKARQMDNRRERERHSSEALAQPVESAIDGLYLGDFRERSKAIPDSSVELIFTDPPYDRESAPLYADAAQVAARILKPGGSMICYTGQILMPLVTVAMSAYLRYWWTAACVHAGGKQMLQKLGIRCGWKPMLWFVKGTRGDVASVITDTISGAMEKDVHEWQQAEAEAVHFIEKLCPADGTVVDFFAGGGTTCVAAETVGRKWIAYEIDPKHYEAAKSRIMRLREVV